MKLNKLSVLKIARYIPVIGKATELRYYKGLLEEVERIEARWFSATVSFKTQIHDLYDCLNGPEIHFWEDFEWFDKLEVNTYSKTAADVVHCLSSITNGWSIKTEDYFKDVEVTKRVPFMKWYSNSHYVEKFLGLAMITMEAYCLRFPRNPEEGPTYEKAGNVYWNPAIANLVTGPYFKMIVDDFITIIRIGLDSHIRRLNG